MTGFLAAAISASFTGKLADKYGRRLACLAFCVIYSLSCLTLLTDDIIILFMGRAFGGISTTLMYSVFESWMVTEYNQLFPDEPGSTLSGIFSTMTTFNSVVAILAGVIAEWVNDLVGTEKAPFMTAVAVLATAFVAISQNWVCDVVLFADVNANFVSRVRIMAILTMPNRMLRIWNHHERAHGNCSWMVRTSLKPNLKFIELTFYLDKRLIALGATSCFFEGSMYIFIFFKFPALKLSHKLAGGDETGKSTIISFRNKF